MEQLKLLSSVLDSLTEEERNACEDNDFPYLFGKAYAYLKMGPEVYRKQDAFRQPSEELDEEELKAIESGCRQILEGKGISEEKPFTGLDVGGFYRLFELFHYNLSMQSAKITKQGMLDRMEMCHVVKENVVVYYNLVRFRNFSPFEDEGSE